MAYSANGKARWLLEQLEDGPLPFGELPTRAIRVHGPRAWQKWKSYRTVMKAMERDGLAYCDGCLDSITALGREALDAMRDGWEWYGPGRCVSAPVAPVAPEPEPTVRVFASEAHS